MENRGLFLLGYWLNPLNPLAWVANRLPFVSTNALPMDEDSVVKGHRYYLPKPFLLVTPRSGKGVEVTTLMIPDPSQEFAVHGWSSFASHSLGLKLGRTETIDSKTVVVDKQILTSVSFGVDNTGVVTTALQQAGTAGEEFVKQAAATSKAEDERRRALPVEIQQAEAKVLDAQTALEQAEAAYTASLDAEREKRLAWMKCQPPDCDRARARRDLDEAQRQVAAKAREVQKAETALKVAQDQLARLLKEKNSLGSGIADIFRRRRSGIADQAGSGPGPALFEVAMTEEGFDLIPMDWRVGAVEPARQLRLAVPAKSCTITKLTSVPDGQKYNLTIETSQAFSGTPASVKIGDQEFMDFKLDAQSAAKIIVAAEKAKYDPFKGASVIVQAKHAALTCEGTVKAE
jgi:hypothetical protein